MPMGGLAATGMNRLISAKASYSNSQSHQFLILNIDMIKLLHTIIIYIDRLIYCNWSTLNNVWIAVF